MAEQDPQELVLAAGGGDIHFAPVGSTLPDDPTTALDSAFVKGGLITEDGASLTRTPEIGEWGSWQKRSKVRRELTGQEYQLVFSLQQWNTANLVFAFGGGAVEETDPGIFRYDFPADTDALAENAVVVEWRDGDKHYRVVLPRGNVTESTETQLQRAELSILPVTFKALAPSDDLATAFLLTDDPAFAEGS